MSSTPANFAYRGGLLGALIIALGGQAQAADEAQSANVDALKKQLDDQTARIETLKRDLAAQEAKIAEMRRQMGLEKVRGGQAPARSGAPAAQPVDRVAQAQPQTQPQQPVGQAPDATESRPQIAPIFEQPGVLTPRGKFVLEPSLQYSYSSNNRIALVGYTIIPAIVVGLIDVREVKRNTWTTTLTGRYGLTNRFEVEARVPYVYRSDDSIGREIGTGQGVDQAFNATGKGIGDIEVTGRYQLNQGGPDRPYYIGGLRFKSRTGKDSFETPVALNVEGIRGGLQTELPTGSGFYTIQPSLTALIPSDPAVFFGSVSYQYNLKRTGVVQKRSDGPDQEIGDVQAGGVFGFNLGMGLAINDRASFSLGYDHQSVAKPKVNGSAPANAVRVQLGQLLVGYSYRLSDKQSVNFSLGAGLTRDTPDLTLSLRVPFTL